MNENIDLTKILKNCPKDTKFYSTVLGEIKFIEIIYDAVYPIIVSNCDDGKTEAFTADGKLILEYDGECVLFPSKDQRDWNKFTAIWYKNLIEPKFHVGQYITDGYVGGKIISIDNNYHCYKILSLTGGINPSIPFIIQNNYHLWTIQDAKDGDVIQLGTVTAIFKKYIGEEKCICYCSFCKDGGFEIPIENGEDNVYGCYNGAPATKEQRDIFMKAMNNAGYKWDTEKKELKKLAESKFNPKTLKPFDKVLGRDHIDRIWKCNLFSHIFETKCYPYKCVGNDYKYCIPYNDDTKHLVGTTGEAPEYYRYWEN